MRLSPGGNFLWAGFSDGTLRVFDLMGTYGLQKDSAVASRQKSTMLVASKWCQTYGAVACQIHARGVHTDLLTHVDVCGDYVFCGVSRGAMELYAVCMKDLEEASCTKNNILDYLQVHVHADAKLKGFGASARLENTKRPTYLLLTGKGIKNIHIWSFQPPIKPNEEPIWTQLYDTQTNGNTINLLGFYRSPDNNKLLGVSKSDTQKLRLWDLSEEESFEEKKERAKRPPYVDVANSQAALGLAGGFCVCGGASMYNQLSVVSLDQPNNAFNHTELALPSVGGLNKSIGSRRQRRGDLKQVVNVASPPQGDSACQLLLELDDGSIVQYSTMGENDGPSLKVLQPPVIPALPADYWSRTLCLATSRSIDTLLVAMSLYNPNTQKGQLILQTLGDSPTKKSLPASPLQADSSALQALCMQAPPPSAKKSRKEVKQSKKSKKKKKSDSISTPKVKSSSSFGVETPRKKKSGDSSSAFASVDSQKKKSQIDVSMRKNFVRSTPLSNRKKQSTSLPGDRIQVNKVKVIPISASKIGKKKSKGLGTPTSIMKKQTRSDSGNSITTLKRSNSVQQVSPEQPSAVKPARKSSKTGVMDKFVVKQKVQQHHAMQQSEPGLKSPPVPGKARQDEFITPDRQGESRATNKKKSKPVDSTKTMTNGKKRLRVPTIQQTNGKKSRLDPTDLATILLDMKSLSTKTKKTNFLASELSRNDIIASRIDAQYKKIQQLLDKLPPFQPAFLCKVSPTAAAKTLEDAQVKEQSELAAQHLVAHEMIRKRLLRSAEVTVRNLMNCHITIDEAKSELKGSSESYQAIVVRLKGM
jgi:hypothetical protein